MAKPARIARIRLELDDVRPRIWRRLELPLTSTLKGLHDAIQAAMPFEDRHLFEVRIGQDRYRLAAEADAAPDARIWSARAARLGAFIDRGVTRLAYAYDFGDDWQFSLTVETVFEADPGAAWPRYVDGAGRAPPEDVGGPPGFAVFLEAIGDPAPPEHRQMRDWHPAPFDPKTPDEAAIQARMSALAERRARGRAGFEKSQAGKPGSSD
ncbi:plasmid pRiA4b ORF-3 family protein (plasmid) [Glycocaulis abyssi]|uniref:Plasmid pRiA4b ORF-3 family protein n=1 Tax=Glycocaulis abyssi TaxID=1433403 RepID=A0ABV9NHB2_9PROT